MMVKNKLGGLFKMEQEYRHAIALMRYSAIAHSSPEAELRGIEGSPHYI